uniref:FCP1 homology domain-containing protein n=1 Tax=Panagrolaimus sp. JU765 TaxID=591449 RepID=A0AC34RE25_9BILA
MLTDPLPELGDVHLDLALAEASSSSSCISDHSNESLNDTSPSLDDVVDFIYSEMENLDPITDGIPQIDIDQIIMLQTMPPLPIEFKHRKPALPIKTRRTPKFSLVLDLDETLVHCGLEEFQDASHKFHVRFDSADYLISVRIRPFMQEFLEALCDRFEIILFTASKKIYADKLLDILDPHKRYFRHRLFREHCVMINGNYVKDLAILGRDLAKTVIIDNSPQAFAYHLDNGIPIESWFDKSTDCQLLELIPFLQSLLDADDVRPVIRERYRMREVISGGNPFSECQQLL